MAALFRNPGTKRCSSSRTNPPCCASKIVLERFGYKVLTAGTPSEAIRSSRRTGLHLSSPTS